MFDLVAYNLPSKARLSLRLAKRSISSELISVAINSNKQLGVFLFPTGWDAMSTTK